MWVSLWKLICAHPWFLFCDTKSKPCTLAKFKSIHTGRKSKIAFPFQLFLLLPPTHLPSLLLLFFSPECPSFISSSYPKHDILCWDQHSQEFSVNSSIFEKYLWCTVSVHIGIVCLLYIWTISAKSNFATFISIYKWISFYSVLFPLTNVLWMFLMSVSLDPHLYFSCCIVTYYMGVCCL